MDSAFGDPVLLQPQVVWAPLPAAANADVDETDIMCFVTAAVNLVKHNIESFNQLMDFGIVQIMSQLFSINVKVRDTRNQTEMDKERESIDIKISFTNVNIGRPVYSAPPNGKIADLMPNHARLSALSYSSAITLAAQVELRASYRGGREEVKRVDIPPFKMSNFPVMYGSSHCHTWNLTREAKRRLQEDPNDVGGYFITRGGEWIIDHLENICFNHPHIHRRVTPNELVRVEFISQAGGVFDNSSQIIIRLLTSGALTAEMNSTKLTRLQVPLYIMFRMLGVTSDQEILLLIVQTAENLDDPITEQMIEILQRSFHVVDASFSPIRDELDHEKIVAFVAEKLSPFVSSTAYTADENAVKYLNNRLLSTLDKSLLPHMGQTPADRYLKMRFIGRLTQRMLRTELGTYPATDRDSYRTKRVHGPGVCLAKVGKAFINLTYVTPTIKSIRRELAHTPFEDLRDSDIRDAFCNPLMQNSSSDLNRILEQSITSGNKNITIQRRTIVNRMSTQVLERKNLLNTLSALRTINTHSGSSQSKQSERAELMRRVHPSYVGYICVAQSADTGEKVGMSKQLAITADVCSAGEAVLLKRWLLADPAVRPLRDVPTAEVLQLANVFVNGEWIGCCARAHELVARYRRLRREGRIVEARTTIFWDPVMNEVEFWLDMGRLTRPLLIVDNNQAEYDEGCRRAAAARRAGEPEPDRHRVPFFQNIRFTRAHIRGILDGSVALADLIREGVCEYISPDEAENCYIAYSVTKLRQHQDDVTHPFTHCDVQQAILGLAAHISPYGNHTQPARVTYETNQARQTSGWYCFNWPYRLDVNRFFQFYNEMPLVKTIAHSIVLANGLNTIVAYAIIDGYNQEDSVYISQAFVDRGGFAGAFYRVERADLEKGEVFTTPDQTRVKNLKPDAFYEKLVNGVVPVGCRVCKGDVIIGRVGKVPARDGSKGATEEVDRSIVYMRNDTAVVEAVYTPRGANDEQFCAVKLRYERLLMVGDKLSSRSGNKCICARLLPTSDLPYCEDGLVPDLIVNPHSLPSRMTIGQMIETVQSILNARLGVISDGSAFRPVDVGAFPAKLAAEGVRFTGCRRMFNGFTGEPFDAAIFIGPTYHQRLQKFVADERYSVGAYGPTDAITGQPLDGHRSQGGLRIGEMEVTVLLTHGAGQNLNEKMHDDSDGRTGYVCHRCGMPAICNPRQNIYKCNTCGEMADIVAVDTRRSVQIFHHELRAANTSLRTWPAPREFEVMASES